MWASVIACAQVLDALQNVIPVAKRHKAAAELVIALDRLLIDALLEWEGIFAGKYTNQQIARKLHHLRILQHQAEARTFHEGLKENKALFRAAEIESETFFKDSYRVN